MGFNIGAGLQALANAGTGYEQGQAQASQNDYTRQMQALTLQNAHQVADQNSQKAQWQQQEMDDMMKGSIAKPTPIINPQTGQPLGTPPPQPPPTADQQAVKNDPVSFFTQLAASARAHGDLVGASEALANLTNVQNTQVKQQEEQSAMQTAELKRQQMHFGMTAQAASTLPDTPEGFAQLKMSVLADPNSSPVEKQNFAKLEYSPGIMQKIAQSGMTAAQKAADSIRQAQLANTQMHDRIMEQQTALRDANSAAYKQADLKLRSANVKAGAISKAPSTEELRTAAPIIANALYGADGASHLNDPMFSGNNVSASMGGTRDLVTPAMTEIAAEAKQIVSNDPSRTITYPQAVEQATQRAIKNGTLVKPTTVTSPRTFFGIPAGTSTEEKPAAFTGAGDTAQNPIPLTKKLHSDPSARIPGKVYNTSKGALRWTKDGWQKP
ncbi:MAG: hypothetical protein KGI54_07115 [Pseudomonadota bacterium]|nr:hypothetical protein [Pseudomonadota bacterium]